MQMLLVSAPITQSFGRIRRILEALLIIGLVEVLELPRHGLQALLEITATVGRMAQLVLTGRMVQVTPPPQLVGITRTVPALQPAP